jgi:hypothetical protein
MWGGGMEGWMDGIERKTVKARSWEGTEGRAKAKGRTRDRGRRWGGRRKGIPPANSTCFKETRYQSSGHFFIKCKSEKFRKKIRTSSVDHEEYFFGRGSPRDFDFRDLYSRWYASIFSRFFW